MGGCSSRALGNRGGGGGNAGGGGNGGGEAGGGGHGGGSHGGGGGSHNGCSGLDQADCLADAACRADYCDNQLCGNTFVGCADVGSGPIACAAKEPNEPPAFCDCDALDEASCIAAEGTWGCTAVYCPTSCNGPMFAGCLGPNEGTISCPIGGPGGCVSGCRSGADCASHTDCLPPDGSLCVACLSPACGSDGDCGSGQVCDWVGCCGSNQCIPACTRDSDCGNLSCGADGHCQPTTCGNGPAGCPVNFECVAGTCGRRPCDTDSDCGSGNYCVEHGCYSQLGVCGGD